MRETERDITERQTIPLSQIFYLTEALILLSVQLSYVFSHYTLDPKILSLSLQ
jgi:hypothetical protein